MDRKMRMGDLIQTVTQKPNLFYIWHPEKSFPQEITDTIWKGIRGMDFFEIFGMRLLFGLEISESAFKAIPKSVEKGANKHLLTDSKVVGYEGFPVLTDEDKGEGNIIESKLEFLYDIDGVVAFLDHYSGKNQD